MPTSNHAAPLLLDTHCWFWMRMGETGRFSEEAQVAVREAARLNALVVSVLSVWEIAMLDAKRRIALQIPCEEWVSRALAVPGLALTPLTSEIAIESTRLPGTIHGDPVDRILVATARRLGARLLTMDRKLIEYGRREHLRILAGS